MTRKETTKFLSDLLIRDRLAGSGKYWTREVTIDSCTNNSKRVDFMQFLPANQMSLSGIEKGTFTCYEVKSCKKDVYSGNGLNFLGENNYIVTTVDCYNDLLPDLQSGKLVKHIRSQSPESSDYFGIMVAVPSSPCFTASDVKNELLHPTTLVGKLENWRLAVVKPCRSGPRNRSMTELLFCMLRSGH